MPLALHSCLMTMQLLMFLMLWTIVSISGGPIAMYIGDPIYTFIGDPICIWEVI